MQKQYTPFSKSNTKIMKYFNFPIKLMQGVLYGNKNRKTFLDDILYYHIYHHYLKLEKVYNETDELAYEETDEQRFKRSANFWSVTVGNTKYGLKRGHELHCKHYKTFVGLNSDVFWDFYKNKKSELEWECLFAYLGLKSILGKKEYAKTNNNLLYARILGKETIDEYKVLKNGIKYTRWHRDKIFTRLQEFWGLSYYSNYNRGFYFGFGIELEKLATIAEKSKEIVRRDILKQQKKEVLNKVKENIKKGLI